MGGPLATRFALLMVCCALVACTRRTPPPTPTPAVPVPTPTPAVPAPPKAAAAGDTHFVYIQLPEALDPLERSAKYEDPLGASLEEYDLGEVTGGGTQLGKKRADGKRPIEFCGVDVELTQLDRGRALLRKRLVELGARPGTELQFDRGEKARVDRLQKTGWVIDRPEK